MKTAILLIIPFTLISTMISCNKFGANKTTVQEMLNENTPISEILTANPVDSLYGKIYQGGLIFHVEEATGTGLIAATEDQSSTATWSSLDDHIIGATGKTIGSGKTNTNAIVDSCSQNFAAAMICTNLSHNGYSDWYLPSKDELRAIYVNLHKKGHGDLDGNYYWSSSSYLDSGAWSLLFSNGDSGFGTRSNLYYVRAIRSF